MHNKGINDWYDLCANYAFDGIKIDNLVTLVCNEW